MIGGGPRFLDEDAEPASPPPAVPPPAGDASRPALPRGPLLLDAEPGAPTALQSRWEPESVARARAGTGDVAWIIAGMAVLAVSVVLFSCVAIVLAMADRSAVLGALAGLAVGSGLGLVGFGLAGEWRAYWRLRMVETTRATLSRPDLPIEDVKAAALAWLALVGTNIPDSAAVAQSVRAATTPATINAVLRERVVAPLQAIAQGIGSRAALEAGTLIALSPHASWDGVIAGLRALKVIHQVARLYGLRPGPAVTLMLIRKVAWTAAGTTGVDLLSQTLADHALGSLPVARHIAAALPGTSLAAMRLYRLARVAAEACCPVPA